ncbi:hypothetical protein U0355_09495 [Salimicrobium sp. PL1-032A]|uniref:hypothetical protein n=1 Tax=Salimicrobium sp. PL1-032A TaxID=3095364 RepID=UPI0032608713
MNKSIKLFGYVLFVSGIILFGIMHLAIASYIPDLTGWSNPPGKLATVLDDIVGWVPYLLSIALFVVGALIMIYDLWQTKQKEHT